jgi:hypothetical protein
MRATTLEELQVYQHSIDAAAAISAIVNRPHFVETLSYGINWISHPAVCRR